MTIAKGFRRFSISNTGLRYCLASFCVTCIIKILVTIPKISKTGVVIKIARFNLLSNIYLLLHFTTNHACSIKQKTSQYKYSASYQLTSNSSQIHLNNQLFKDNSFSKSQAIAHQMQEFCRPDRSKVI
jgi:hypothetical protein